MLLALSAVAALHASHLPGLVPGTYVPTESNEPSICPQEVRTRLRDDGRLASLSVVYAGDCAGQGPYLYPCFIEESGETVCESGVIRFEISEALGSRAYRWHNEAYGFEARLDHVP